MGRERTALAATRRGWLHTAAALATSVAAHGTILLLASIQVWQASEPARFVRVSLREPGAGVAGAGQIGAAEMAAPVEPPAAAAAAPEPVAKPPVPRRAGKVAARRAPPPPRPKPAAIAQPSNLAAADFESESAAAVGRDGALTAGGSAAGGAHGGGIEGLGSGAGSGADQRPRCVYCPEPPYPLVARRRGWEGTVDVDVDLSPDGRVDAAQVRRSSGYELLDEAAVSVARRSRFSAPAAPVKGSIEYQFQISTTLSAAR